MNYSREPYKPEDDLPEVRNAEPTEDIVAMRRATCDACEHKVAGGVLCGKCGCVIFLKTKWKSQECPVGKWEKGQRLDK